MLKLHWQCFRIWIAPHTCGTLVTFKFYWLFSMAIICTDLYKSYKAQCNVFLLAIGQYHPLYKRTNQCFKQCSHVRMCPPVKNEHDIIIKKIVSYKQNQIMLMLASKKWSLGLQSSMTGATPNSWGNIKRTCYISLWLVIVGILTMVSYDSYRTTW